MKYIKILFGVFMYVYLISIIDSFEVSDYILVNYVGKVTLMVYCYLEIRKKVLL